MAQLSAVRKRKRRLMRRRLRRREKGYVKNPTKDKGRLKRLRFKFPGSKE